MSRYRVMGNIHTGESTIIDNDELGLVEAIKKGMSDISSKLHDSRTTAVEVQRAWFSGLQSGKNVGKPTVEPPKPRISGPAQQFFLALKELLAEHNVVISADLREYETPELSFAFMEPNNGAMAMETYIPDSGNTFTKNSPLPTR